MLKWPGISRDAVIEQLMVGDPVIAVAEDRTDGIHLNPMTLEPGEDEIIVERLIEVINGG